MRKGIALGSVNYEAMKSNNSYVVDKSMMIKDFIEFQNTVTLITRPRRFGKTINMSMLASFFDITKDSKELFKDTAIMQTEYAKELNQWPTIFLSFAGAKEEKRQVAEGIKRVLREEFNRYEFVFENLSKLETVDYDKCIWAITSNEENLHGIDNAISFLMKMLEKYYHKKVMLFIDEYDTPFIEAHATGFYNEIKGGLSALLHNSLKLSSSLQQAMITGIQRVAKENIFSDLNNLIVCGVYSKNYAQYFGFTEEETSTLLNCYGLSLNDEVKAMYDGYRIGDMDIYNPWSILNYASNQELIPYWVNTSSNTMIKLAIKDSEPGFKEKYEHLIRNGVVEVPAKMGTSFYEISTTENLWGLLVNAGYLTIEETVSKEDEIFKLRIPNREVQKEFISLTESYLEIENGNFSLMTRYLIKEQKESFLDSYRNVLLQIPSYYDLKDENSYHMMMLGLCVCLNREYGIISNREEGNGRCDILLKAKHLNMPSFVIEFKYLKKDMNDENKKKLKELANSAINQIKENKYDANLNGKVIYIGLAHCGKEVEMQWEEN